MVTGAASGFGLATAKRLLAIGYKVACCDTAFSHSTPDETFLDQLEEPENAMFFGMNPLSTNDITSVLETIRSTCGEAPRVLVNSQVYVESEDMINRVLYPHSLSAFRSVIESNVVGDFNVVRLVAKGMVENVRGKDDERGVIINTSSISAINGSGAQVAYSCAMAGISGMTLPLARALGRFGIRVVSILPGLFDTPEMKEYEDTVMVMSKMTPFPRRLGVPEEFAHLVETIVGNPMLNGCNIRLDGGIRS
ncbi:hypothetical protein BLSTO_00751 [Blastocystis sp. subtype 1]